MDLFKRKQSDPFRVWRFLQLLDELCLNVLMGITLLCRGHVVLFQTIPRRLQDHLTLTTRPTESCTIHVRSKGGRTLVAMYVHK